ncbi:MAG: ADP-ribosylglycohydrolase family protein [Dorea sp.]|nr:ADP-ribosylglycohydrolase family protein [Dorea sp.]
MKNILEEVRLAFISRKRYLETELRQSMEEGKDTAPYRQRAQEIMDMEDDKEAESAAILLYEKLQKELVRPDYPYQEPEELDRIIALFPEEKEAEPENLKDRLLGAWVGRAAGCLLGQPVEGWERERITGFAKATGNYPIQSYMSSEISEEIRGKFQIKDYPGNYGNKMISWVNHITCMPEDDDMNYTVMGVGIVEKYGHDFQPVDAAEFLTTNIPIFLTCTAERMAYKNIINGILPPKSASYGNPYREWLGAQIRADGYAYINAGNPYKAAVMAVKDASVTHTKNGIYAAAFCAALIAESAVADHAKEAIQCALLYIPKTSRLYVELTSFLDRWERNADTEKLLDYIHGRFDEKNQHDWCHVIPNDMIICLSLLNGGDDYTKVIGIAVEAGFDTDCNAATAGSAFGMMYGIGKIPESWQAPLRGQMVTRIGSQGKVKFTELAEACIKQRNRR